jgi:predicted phosphodiesterase
MSKKILFISDTHGDNTVYKEIIDCEKADLVVHAGDYHDFHFSSPHTIVELDARVDHSILGNHGLGIKKFSKSSSLPSNEELMEEYIGDHKIIKFDYLTILLTHIFDFSPRSMNGNIGNVEAFRTL